MIRHIDAANAATTNWANFVDYRTAQGEMTAQKFNEMYLGTFPRPSDLPEPSHDGKDLIIENRVSA